MMKNKKLTLVRHAKSSWDYNVIDSKRPLAKRGNNDAKLVSGYLLNRIPEPDIIFTSPATRALKTCQIFSDKLKIAEFKVNIKDELYDFDGESVVKFIRSLDNKYNHVMIFGHNHAFTSISNIFGDKFIENLPTSGVVIINFEIDEWKNISKGQTEMILFPKKLK